MSTEAISTALRLALTNGNPSAEPVHLLRALLMVPDNPVAPLLAKVGVDAKRIDALAQEAIKTLPSSSGSSVAQPTISGSLPWASVGDGECAELVGVEGSRGILCATVRGCG